MAKIYIEIVSNNPPTVSDYDVGNIPNRSSITLQTSFFTNNYSDPENDAFGGIKITSLPSKGELRLGGSTITSVPTSLIPKSDLDAGKLKYYADPNDTSSYSVSFDFVPCDDKGACA